jgi:hypothetical protein
LIFHADILRSREVSCLRGEVQPPSFVGSVEDTQEDLRWLRLRAEAPRWAAGKTLRVLGLSHPPDAGEVIGLVDAAPAGIDQVRVRWQTQLVPWRALRLRAIDSTYPEIS